MLVKEGQLDYEWTIRPNDPSSFGESFSNGISQMTFVPLTNSTSNSAYPHNCPKYSIRDVCYMQNVCYMPGKWTIIMPGKWTTIMPGKLITISNKYPRSSQKQTKNV
ncbi:hypothetical protein WUBG_08481 [Wuchereria bancrofti]|uniref:Uncharacterized protein n=1 Tax=Wuchereria bancrofti TaxID=6293 RepID=J9EZQ8_WUCBA|nr:hypothetical protein WUBG_08481 [Wuchereria bancrofti]VDM12541.1 unnamed protein product [Wuchereria bancrofti]